MKEEMIQILNVTRQELVDIIKEGVKLELNRQKAIGQNTFNVSHIKYLKRSETAKLLHVTLVILNNWEKKNILVPSRIGRRVLYKEAEVLERLDHAA
ncbi:helix-turn-helix domain-containing protein [Polaribacter sp.]|nr:helix-turn-helix domain-containing protein [Polaribacter sp.]